MNLPDPLRPTASGRFGRVLRATVGKLLLAAFRVREIGRAHVPAGGAILAGNHISYGDPVLLWCRSPRPVHFMAKSELWDVPVLGWALSQVWAFPVRRGQADRQALAVAHELLKRGDLVGIFPEGTRNRTGDAEAQGGVAFAALRADVPVVPVGIAGTDRIKPTGARMIRFPRVTIRYGEPIHPAQFAEIAGRKERVEAFTAVLMARIAEELDAARKA